MRLYRKKLLTEADLTLAKAIQIAQANKRATANVLSLYQTEAPLNQLRVVSGDTPSSFKHPCHYCGCCPLIAFTSWHLAIPVVNKVIQHPFVMLQKGRLVKVPANTLHRKPVRRSGRHHTSFVQADPEGEPGTEGDVGSV